MRKKIAAVLLAGAFALSVPAAAVAAQATPPPKHNPPKSIYLALGDSAAFGLQAPKFFQTTDPAAFNTGYVDLFARDLRAKKPNIRTVNLSCPGETTDSLLGLAPCIYHPPYALHTDYSGSQIDAALAVLRAHPGQVSPVTIDVGANDRLFFNQSFAHIEANFSTIIARLRDAAPYTEIIVLGYWNPLTVSIPPYFFAPNGAEKEPRILWAQLNSVLAGVAARYRAHFADPLPVFNPPVNEIPTICSLTLECPPTGDVHPSDLGYEKLADLVLAASGY
jgi:lysophospholipase L1-like esterase